jgi:hypothetical protein
MGMTAARQLRRKTMMTGATRTIATPKVWVTASID